MRKKHGQGGATLLWAIAALVVIGAVGAGINSLTSSSTTGTLANSRGQAARYAAESGRNFANCLDAATFETIRAESGSKRTYTMDSAESFSLTVGAPNSGIYPVQILGSCEAGTPNEANFLLSASITPVVVTPTEWSGGDYVISTDGDLSLPQSAKINGSVSGKNLTLSQYADVSGNVISDTSASLGQYAKTGGYVCAASGNVSLHQYAEVTGDVSANGSITVGQYAIAHKNAYATGSIDMSQHAKILLTGQAGTSIRRAQYDYIGTPLEWTTPTITCPETVAPVAQTITATGTVNVPASSAATPIPPRTDYKAWNTNQHGSGYLTSGTYTFQSIQYSQYMDLYLDVSSGNPLTVLVVGSINTGQYTTLHVKTPNTGGQYLTVADIEAKPAATKAKIHADAKLIYMGAGTSMQWSQYGTWWGTLYAKTSLSTGQFFFMVGALACPGNLSISSGMEIYEYILADYAKQNWR